MDWLQKAMLSIQKPSTHPALFHQEWGRLGMGRQVELRMWRVSSKAWKLAPDLVGGEEPLKEHEERNTHLYPADIDMLLGLETNVVGIESHHSH